VTDEEQRNEQDTLSIEVQLNEYLLAINIAVRQNPRWVPSVHELLGVALSGAAWRRVEAQLVSGNHPGIRGPLWDSCPQHTTFIWSRTKHKSLLQFGGKTGSKASADHAGHTVF
jgi:hypothetical protein